MRGGRAGRWHTAGWMWCVCCGELALLQRPKEVAAKKALTAAAVMAATEDAEAVLSTSAMVLAMVLAVVSQSIGVGSVEIGCACTK